MITISSVMKLLPYWGSSCLVAVWATDVILRKPARMTWVVCWETTLDRQPLLLWDSPALLDFPQGKGEQITFWLKGREDFTIPLPEFAQKEAEVPGFFGGEYFLQRCLWGPRKVCGDALNIPFRGCGSDGPVVKNLPTDAGNAGSIPG